MQFQALQSCDLMEQSIENIQMNYQWEMLYEYFIQETLDPLFDKLATRIKLKRFESMVDGLADLQYNAVSNVRKLGWTNCKHIPRIQHNDFLSD